MVCFGQQKTWYGKKSVQDFEMSVFFDENSLLVKPYYDFHLKKYSDYLKQNSSAKVMIVHKDQSNFSRIRALRLKNHIVSRHGVRPNQIRLNVGLPSKYLVSSGEKLMLFARDEQRVAGRKPLRQVKKPVRTAIRKPAVAAKSQKKAKRDVIYIPRAPKVRLSKMQADLGLRRYSFSNVNKDLHALALNFSYERRINPIMHAVLDVGMAFSESTSVSGREYNLSTGLNSDWNGVELSTKVYGRRNWAWVESDSKSRI